MRPKATALRSSTVRVLLSRELTCMLQHSAKKTNKKTHFTLHVDDVDVLPHLNSRECRQQSHSVVMEIKSETKATASLLV